MYFCWYVPFSDLALTSTVYTNYTITVLAAYSIPKSYMTKIQARFII